MAMTPEEAAARAKEAVDVAVQAAEDARRFLEQAMAGADVLSHGAGAASGIDPFIFQLAIFVLSIFVGYFVVWAVTPALHTPLMSVTNAISSVIVVGALLAVAAGSLATGSILAMIFGFLALVLASVNIFGGFLVTQRMLAMYKKKG
jgi:H+-translocating NAD(P) transhydrogenase subunit alpha